MAATQPCKPRPVVVQLVDSFHQGGSERQALQLTAMLAATGRYQLHVAALSGEGVLRPDFERLGLGDIPEFPLTSFYDGNARRQLRRLVHYLREQQADLVHSHDFYTNVFGMVGAAWAGVGARIASRREIEGRPLWKRAGEHCAYHLAHAIIANSEQVRRRVLLEGAAPAKVVTIHNGVDASRVAPTPGLDRDAVLASFGLPSPGRSFVTLVANLRWAVKDHPTFLQAARRVRERCSAAAFVIAGEGPLLGSMQELARQLGIGADTFFLGRCQRLGDLLAVSDVCVLSSISEGFSNSILEYMAAARPVVATDVGGARECIREGETGYVVPPRDSHAMADRIVRLLMDPERAQAFGRRGRERVLQDFSPAVQLRKTEELYRVWLRSAGAGSP